MMTTERALSLGLPDPTLKASERGPGHPVTPRRLAVEHVHAVHPDTGLTVVFVPGEVLPVWAIEPDDPEEPAPEPTKRRGSMKAAVTKAAKASEAAGV